MVGPGSATARALDYSLKRWVALTRYPEVGAITLLALEDPEQSCLILGYEAVGIVATFKREAAALCVVTAYRAAAQVVKERVIFYKTSPSSEPIRGLRP